MKNKTTRLLSMILITCMLATCVSGCSGCGKKNEAPGETVANNSSVSTPVTSVEQPEKNSTSANDEGTETEEAKELLVKASKDEVLNALIEDYDFGMSESDYAIQYLNNRVGLMEYYLYNDSSLDAYSIYKELKEDAGFIRECISSEEITVNSELDTEAILSICNYIDSFDKMMPYVLTEGTSEEYFEESWGQAYNYNRRYSSLLTNAEKNKKDFELLYSAIKMTVEEDYWYYIEYSSSQSIVDAFLAIIDEAENNDGKELPEDYPVGDSEYYERLAIKAYSIMKAYTKAADRASYAYAKYGERDFVVSEMENYYLAGNSSKVTAIASDLLQDNADDYEALFYAACAGILNSDFDFCIDYGSKLADYVSKGTYEQKEADYYLFSLVQKMTVLNDGSFGDNLGFYTKLSDTQKNKINENKLFGTYINAFRGAYDEAFDKVKGNPLEVDDLEKSKEYADALIALLPECAYPYYIYACLQYRLDDFEKAVTATEYAVNLVPVDSMFYMLLASSYEELAMGADADKAKEYWSQCYRNAVIARDMTPWVYNHDKDFYGVGVHSMTILDSGAEFRMNGFFDKPQDMVALDMMSEEELNRLAVKYEELYGINDGYYLFHIAAMMENETYGWKDIRAELDKIENKSSELYYFLRAEYNVRYEYDSELTRVKLTSEAVYDNPLWDYANTLIGTELVAEKHFERALPYLQKAVTLNADNAYAWAMLGVCYYGQTFYSDAEGAFATAMSLIDDETDPLYEFVSRYTVKDSKAARYVKSLPVMENMYRAMFNDRFALYSLLDEFIDDDDTGLFEDSTIGSVGGYRYVTKRNSNGYASDKQLKQALEKSFKALWVNFTFDTNTDVYDYYEGLTIADEAAPKAPRPNFKADVVTKDTNQDVEVKKDITSGERAAITSGTALWNSVWTLLGGDPSGLHDVDYGNSRKKAEQERARKEIEEKRRKEAEEKEAKKKYNFDKTGEGFNPEKAPGYYDDSAWTGDKNKERVKNYYLILMLNAYREKDEKRAAELARIWFEREKTMSARSSINASDLNCKKPNIYIYTEEATDITVTLGKPGKLTASDPIYKDSWTVTANPSGTLICDGEEYGYLFYECDVPAYEFKAGNGFVITSENREKDLREVLGKYEFNTKETEDFIEFWADYLEGGKDYLMVPQSLSMVERSMPLDMSVKADSITRLWFGFFEISGEVSVEEPDVTPVSRDGLTVVEWGGAIVE